MNLAVHEPGLNQTILLNYQNRDRCFFTVCYSC